jgi:hypothetical protein
MLTPYDFMDEQHCHWFVLSKAKAGPNLRYACTTCSTISRTKECPAFRGEASKTIRKGAALLQALRRPR